MTLVTGFNMSKPSAASSKSLSVFVLSSEAWPIKHAGLCRITRRASVRSSPATSSNASQDACKFGASIASNKGSSSTSGRASPRPTREPSNWKRVRRSASVQGLPKKLGSALATTLGHFLANAAKASSAPGSWSTARNSPPTALHPRRRRLLANCTEIRTDAGTDDGQAVRREAGTWKGPAKAAHEGSSSRAGSKTADPASNTAAAMRRPMRHRRDRKVDGLRASADVGAPKDATISIALRSRDSGGAQRRTSRKYSIENA
mmetsp:Transcript_23815/g.66565  ORF Transcript_23815/g.66565 Transcript_23815/m.66565 type:complete len:261 (+) Transcript_23815:653-1435(+)